MILDIPGVEVDPLARTQFPSRSCGSAMLRMDDRGLEKEVRDNTVPNGKYLISVFFFDIAFTFSACIIFS